MVVIFTNDPTFWLLYSLQRIIIFENIFSTQTYLPFCIFVGLIFLGLFTYWAFSSPGGPAWKNGRAQMGRVPIPGPKGLPFFGTLFSLSHGLAHHTLATMAQARAAKELMAFSLGSTPVVVTSNPEMAREILTSPYFADRPIKQSAKELMFSRAIGFAPNGTHWRLLRRIAASHLFSPRRILAYESGRMLECTSMLNSIFKEQVMHGGVSIRKHLQEAALNNIMGSVFGKRYDFTMQNNICGEAAELQQLVKEGFELLGAFNWSDHLPWLKHCFDPSRIVQRCSVLVPCVRRLVGKIIKEHRESKMNNCINSSENSDFVDVLLSLDGEEKLNDDDMVAMLWEMIFRGTDTIALTIEWIIAEIILNPIVQSKLECEISSAIANEASMATIAKLPYLQAVVKETLRLHPPGPLLSWARLSNTDVHLSNGMVVPKGTTTLVNMWSITHDLDVWDNPYMFKPERFFQNSTNGKHIDIDVRGSDLRLAPFGAGRRVCPGKDLALVTVSQWVAMLVFKFKWVQHKAHPVDLSEELKLSCEMKYPLSAVAIPRNCFVEKQQY